MFGHRFRFLPTLVTLVIVALAACTAPAQRPIAASATTAAPAPGAIVVTDALNRTVKFIKPPQRIVLAGKAFFMILDALYLFPEAAQRVVGLPEQTQSKTDFYSVIDPVRTNKTFFEGNDVGPEQIIPAKPDVVITKSVNASKLGKGLEQVNVPVVYVDFELPEQYARDLAILGQVLGNPDRAKEIDAYYKGQMERVAGKIRGVKDADKPKVLLLQSAEKGGTVAFSVAPAEWMQTILVERAGGQAIWKQASDKGGWTVVNLEQIAAWDPDMVLIVSYGGNSKDVVARVEADPQWQSFKAVRENKVYGFPSDFYTWDQPDARWGLGLVWLATKTQPSLFADVNIYQEIDRFYALYGLDHAAIQSKVAPLLQGDLP